MSRPLARSLILFALAGLTACSRCEGPVPPAEVPPPPPPGPLAIVPAESSAAILLSPLGTLAKAASTAFELAGRNPQGGAQIEEIKQLLGFDPSTESGLGQAGLDPGRDTALVMIDATSAPVMLLPVVDPALVEKGVRHLASVLGRADKIGPVTIAGKQALMFSRSFGDRSIDLGGYLYDQERKLGYLSLGRGASATFGHLLATVPARSLARAERFKEARSRVEGSQGLIWLGDANVLGPQLGDLAKLAPYSIIGINTEQGALSLDGLVALTPEARTRITSALDLGQQAPSLFTLAEADAVLVAAGRANMKTLLEAYRAEQTGADLKALARQAGVDVNEAVLERLQGGMGVALYIDPTEALTMPRNPRDVMAGLNGLLGFCALFELRSETSDVLTVMDSYFKEQGLKISRRSVGESEIHTAQLTGAKRPTAEFHYGVRAKHLLWELGNGKRLERLLERMESGRSGGIDQDMAATLRSVLTERQGGTLYLSTTRLTSRLRELALSPVMGEARMILQGVAELLEPYAGFYLQARGEPDALRLRIRIDRATAPEPPASASSTPAHTSSSPAATSRPAE